MYKIKKIFFKNRRIFVLVTTFIFLMSVFVIPASAASVNYDLGGLTLDSVDIYEYDEYGEVVEYDKVTLSVDSAATSDVTKTRFTIVPKFYNEDGSYYGFRAGHLYSNVLKFSANEPLIQADTSYSVVCDFNIQLIRGVDASYDTSRYKAYRVGYNSVGDAVVEFGVVDRFPNMHITFNTFDPNVIYTEYYIEYFYSFPNDQNNSIFYFSDFNYELVQGSGYGNLISNIGTFLKQNTLWFVDILNVVTSYYALTILVIAIPLIFFVVSLFIRLNRG